MNSSRLLENVDNQRLQARRKLDATTRSDYGQFMTPTVTARLMASMFKARSEDITLLDAGAGVGSLTAAFVDEICNREQRPSRIDATLYEIDPVLVDYLRDTLCQCEKTCAKAGVRFEFEVIDRDFIDDAVRAVKQDMFKEPVRYDCAILNPPYKKINSDSEARRMLRAVGIETSNIYTGFLSLVLKLLARRGEIVAITPRSFCNGTYFKPFRKTLLQTLAIDRIHIFESRRAAFREDNVLQENVIIHGVKDTQSQTLVTISSSAGPADGDPSSVQVRFEQLVHKGDSDFFMHIVTDQAGASVASRMRSLEASLHDLNLEISTGRVVDFRATELLRAFPGQNSVPLIYPVNFSNGFIEWPKVGRKPQAMAGLPGAERLLVPKGIYVLVKRFSSKEEDRRVVAAIYDPSRVEGDWVGFENHTNYFHRGGRGIPLKLAKGLTAFLNSKILDAYFRQFSGHTQVNATDLRNLKYPAAHRLEALGNRIADTFPDQRTLDIYVHEEIFDSSG